jgi:hypothetical protein
MCVHVSLRVFVPLCLCASGPLGLWASGPLGLWASGPLGLWASGPLGLWASLPLCLSISHVSVSLCLRLESRAVAALSRSRTSCSSTSTRTCFAPLCWSPSATPVPRRTRGRRSFSSPQARGKRSTRCKAGCSFCCLRLGCACILVFDPCQWIRAWERGCGLDGASVCCPVVEQHAPGLGLGWGLAAALALAGCLCICRWHGWPDVAGACVCLCAIMRCNGLRH